MRESAEMLWEDIRRASSEFSPDPDELNFVDQRSKDIANEVHEGLTWEQVIQKVKRKGKIDSV